MTPGNADMSIDVCVANANSTNDIRSFTLLVIILNLVTFFESVAVVVVAVAVAVFRVQDSAALEIDLGRVRVSIFRLIEKPYNGNDDLK